MPFTDLISVSPLILDDLEEAVNVQVSGHIRDPAMQSVTPHRQRDMTVKWQARLKRARAAWRGVLLYPGTIVLVAKYIPENRIVGVVSSAATHLAEQSWCEKGSNALRSRWTLSHTFSLFEVNPDSAYALEQGHKAAFEASGITGHFWHMYGICVLSGFERKGVAHKMIDTLFQKIARVPQAPRQVFVQTNSTSRRLYERYGFKLCCSHKIDLNPAFQTQIQKNAASAGYPPAPRYHTEHYLTYDLTELLHKSAKAGRPVVYGRSGSEAAETFATLKQFNRILRPVSSISDLNPQEPTRLPKGRKDKDPMAV